MKLCHGYTVTPDGDGLVVTCAECGPSRIDMAHARHLVDDLVGLDGPLGRFLVHADRATRGDLAAKLRAALAVADC